MIRLSWWEERRSSESGIKLEMRIVAFVSMIVMVVGCLLDPQSVQESSADTSEYTVRDLQLINETNGMMWWGDVYVSDLDGGSLERITDTAPLYQGNENMEYSPDGTKIAWSHHDDEEPGRKVEIYLMDADGSNPTRLTYFNQLGHPHRKEFQKFGFTNACGELDWGPYGRSIVFSMSNGGKLLWPYLKPNIYMLTFEGQARLLQGVYLPIVLR